MAQSLVINSKQVKKIENVDRENKVIKQIMCNGKVIFEAEAETKKIIINTTHVVLCDIYDGRLKLASLGTLAEKQKELSLQDGRTYTIKNLTPIAGYWFKESEINFTVDQLSAGSIYDIEPELQKTYQLSIKPASDDRWLYKYDITIISYEGDSEHYSYHNGIPSVFKNGLSTTVASGARVIITSDVKDFDDHIVAYAPQADFIIGKDGTRYGDNTARRYATIYLTGVSIQDAENGLYVDTSDALRGWIPVILDWQESDDLCYNIIVDGDYNTSSDYGKVYINWNLDNQGSQENIEMPWLSSGSELNEASIEFWGTICDERHLIHFPDAEGFYDIWEW